MKAVRVFLPTGEEVPLDYGDGRREDPAPLDITSFNDPGPTYLRSFEGEFRVDGPGETWEEAWHWLDRWRQQLHHRMVRILSFRDGRLWPGTILASTINQPKGKPAAFLSCEFRSDGFPIPFPAEALRRGHPFVSWEVQIASGRAHPLVYADWCEEIGSWPERAELLRVEAEKIRMGHAHWASACCGNVRLCDKCRLRMRYAELSRLVFSAHRYVSVPGK